MALLTYTLALNTYLQKRLLPPPPLPPSLQPEAVCTPFHTASFLPVVSVQAHSPSTEPRTINLNAEGQHPEQPSNIDVSSEGLSEFSGLGLLPQPATYPMHPVS